MRTRTKYILTAILAALLLVIGAIAFLLPASAKEEQRVTASAASMNSTWEKYGDGYWGYIDFQPGSESSATSGSSTVSYDDGYGYSWYVSDNTGETWSSSTLHFERQDTEYGTPCQYRWYVTYSIQGTVASGSVTIHPRKYQLPAYEATCTSAGQTGGYICQFCGSTYPYQPNRTIPALGHDLTQHDAKEPTCTSVGWEAYEDCSRCDYTTYAEIEALGHDWESESVTSTISYCSDTRNTCTRCNEFVYESTGTSSREQHTYTSNVTSQATCTTTGRRRYTCTKCSYSYLAVISALGHNYGSYVTTTEPTCAEAGVETASCSRCTSTTTRTVSALGHDWETESVSSTYAYCSDTRNTCTRCSEVIYESTGTSSRDSHTLTSRVTSQATCTSAGTRLYSCNKCSYSYSSTISALGHNYGSYVTTTEPTCTEAGIETASCSRCTSTTTRAVSALGHDLEDHAAQAPTCTEIGWNAYETCSRCDYTTYEEIEATGHTPGAAATCTTAQTCDVCSTVLAEALGHDLTQHEAKAPTCTEIGWNAYETCSRCDYTTYEEIEATGHTPGAAATCTTAQTCDVCGTVLAEALGHDYQNGYCDVCGTIDEAALEEDKGNAKNELDDLAQSVKDEINASDLPNDVKQDLIGSVDQAIEDAKGEVDTAGDFADIDSILQEVETEINNSILNAEKQQGIDDLSNFAENVRSEIEASDLSEGEKADRYEQISAVVESANADIRGAATAADVDRIVEAAKDEIEGIQAIGHIAGPAATCTTAQTCIVCGKELVPALGHTPGAAATCTTAQTCSVCGTVLAPATGHTAADAVRENEVAPTCTANGSYEEVVYCDVCSVELSRRTVTVNATGHTFGPDATCTEDQTCLVCGEVISAATGHIPGPAATCTTAQTCSVCGTVLAEALGHDLTQYEAQAPTCTEIGWNAYETCSRCDYTTYEEIGAAGHTAAEPVRENEVAATCTESGSYDSVVYCDVCNAELSRRTVTIAALWHDEIRHEAQAPTCTEIGWSAYVTCSRCDYTTFRAIAATGHTTAEAVRENEVAPTCTTNGSYDSVVYCDVCDAELSRNTVTVDATGHVFENGYCGVCGAEENPALENDKDTTNEELDDIAQNVKDEINASDLPDDVKEDLIDRVDQVIEDAKGEVSGAQSSDELDEIVGSVNDAIEDAILEAEKENTKNELDDLAQSVKDEINASDLPDDVKEDLIGSVDQAIEDAKAEIDAAQSADGFDQLIENVTAELDELVSGTSGTEEAKGELWPWLVGAIVLALILSALYATLRIRKARKYGQTVGAKIIITIAVISILIFVVIIGIAVLLFSLI